MHVRVVLPVMAVHDSRRKTMMLVQLEKCQVVVLLLVCVNTIPLCVAENECGTAEDNYVDIYPQTVYLHRDKPYEAVQVLCAHPAETEGQEHLERLELLLRSTPKDSVTTADLIKATGATITDLARRPSFEVGYSNDENKSVTYTLKRAACADADKTYECLSKSRLNSFSFSCLKMGEFKIASEPTDVRMRVVPDVEEYSVGEKITISCSATVAVKGEDTRAEWVWETKSEEGSWEKLDGDVYLDRLESISDCLMVRHTGYNALLRGHDHGRSYRCWVKKDGSSNFRRYGKELTIKVDAFIFELSFAVGTVVLILIIIMVLAILVIIFTVVRYFIRAHHNKERAMYRERVLNRLDKLLRYEHETLGSSIKKRPFRPPTPVKVAPEPESSVDPQEIQIQIMVPQPEEEEEDEPPPPPKKPKRHDFTGPMFKM